jgi:hypothetical protein
MDLHHGQPSEPPGERQRSHQGCPNEVTSYENAALGCAVDEAAENQRDRDRGPELQRREDAERRVALMEREHREDGKGRARDPRTERADRLCGPKALEAGVPPEAVLGPPRRSQHAPRMLAPHVATRRRPIATAAMSHSG